MDLVEDIVAAQSGDLQAYGRVVKCARAWDIGVEQNGEYLELIGCGVYHDDVVRLLGGDPARHTALGLGLGLERTAALRYGLADLRGLETSRV